MKLDSKNVVISQTPYRLCLGGGTDLNPYVHRYGGHALSATIDKYVTVVVKKRKDNKIFFHYALGTEAADRPVDVKHPYVRAALKHADIQGGVDIASFADVPFASGLGSSGAFTVGLINALWGLSGVRKNPRELAEEAAHIEIDMLQNPIGKHDQYLAAYGGICDLRFLRNGRVLVKKIKLAEIERKKLESHILLFYSGTARSASRQLSPLYSRLLAHDYKTTQAMHEFRKAGLRMGRLLRNRDFINFGITLNALAEIHKKHWPSNSRFDGLIAFGKKNGALGGMASGAGGGGFIFFVCPDDSAKKRVARVLSLKGVEEYPFRITPDGSRITYSK